MINTAVRGRIARKKLMMDGNGPSIASYRLPTVSGTGRVYFTPEMLAEIERRSVKLYWMHEEKPGVYRIMEMV